MVSHKINIIGASGTGKTTLARALAQKLGCVHLDSDDYFHYPTDPPFQKQRSHEERVSLLTHDLNKAGSWILSGGAATWDPPPAVQYTLVVFLYLPLQIRLERLRAREKELFGSRILAGGDMEKTHSEFMEWTKGYDDGTAEGTNTRPHHEAFLKKLDCPLVRFDKPLSTNDMLETILSILEVKK